MGSIAYIFLGFTLRKWVQNYEWKIRGRAVEGTHAREGP